MPEFNQEDSGFDAVFQGQRVIWHNNCSFFFALYIGMPFLLGASSIFCFKSSHPWWASVLTYVAYFFISGVMVLMQIWSNQIVRYYILKIDGPIPEDGWCLSVSERIESSACLVLWHSCFFNMIYFVMLVAAYTGSDR